MPLLDDCIGVFLNYVRIMKQILSGILMAVLLPAGIAAAQAPFAGSGRLPSVDPSAQSPKIVVDAIAKVLSNRRDRRPFLDINPTSATRGSRSC